MTDESTDISILKQLVLVCRYSTCSGIKTSFLQITDIPNGTADTIEAALLQVLSGNGVVDISRLRGFGTDGAAVMTGSRNGVATKLRSHSPRMISVHCINHRLALTAAHAADGIPYIQRFKSILQSLFYFYQNSAVRMVGLHAIQEVLDQPMIKCKEAKDVRWLSHDMAIKAVIRTYPAILISLDREASERGEPTAHGLLKFMKCYKFLACAYLLSDVLPHLSRLSRIFQKQNIDLSLIQPCLRNVIDCIKQYRDTFGPNLSKLDAVISSELESFTITLTERGKKEFKSSIQVPYIEGIVKQLEDRFPNVDCLDAFSIFDPQKIPSSPEQMVAYGQDKIDYLQKHYGEGENPDVGDECASEWESMKRFLGERFKEKSMREMISILTTDTSIQSLYPNLSKLASIAAIIPVSTAECERSFSAMKRIKTALRNRLKTTTLDCLM